MVEVILFLESTNYNNAIIDLGLFLDVLPARSEIFKFTCGCFHKGIRCLGVEVNFEDWDTFETHNGNDIQQLEVIVMKREFEYHAGGSYIVYLTVRPISLTVHKDFFELLKPRPLSPFEIEQSKLEENWHDIIGFFDY